MTESQSQPCGLRGTGRSTKAWQDPMRQLGLLWPLTPAIFLNTSSGPDCPRPQMSRARLTQTQEAANNCLRVRREDEKAVPQACGRAGAPQMPTPGSLDQGTRSLTWQKELQMGLRLRAS